MISTLKDSLQSANIRHWKKCNNSNRKQKILTEERTELCCLIFNSQTTIRQQHVSFSLFLDSDSCPVLHCLMYRQTCTPYRFCTAKCSKNTVKMYIGEEIFGFTTGFLSEITQISKLSSYKVSYTADNFT